MIEIKVTGTEQIAAQLRAMTLAAEAVARQPVSIGTADPIAKYVVYGTRPHTITAHGGGLFWPGAAHPVRVVHHPGTRANPFLDAAETEAVPVWMALVERAFIAIAEGAGAGTMETALDAADQAILDAERKHAPVKTGTLRDSLHIDRLGGAP